MKTEPYKKHIEYLFEVDGEMFAIADIEPDYAYISETRKNGQEDTHQTGSIWRDSLCEPFQWADGCEDSFDNPDAILAYINKYGLPSYE